jgi:hypothetical protein
VGVRLKVVGRFIPLLRRGLSGGLAGRLGLLALVIHAPALVEGRLDGQAVVGELLGELLELGLQLGVLLQEVVHGGAALAVGGLRFLALGLGAAALLLPLGGRLRQVIQTEDQRVVLEYGDQQLVVGQKVRRNVLGQRGALFRTPPNCRRVSQPFIPVLKV